MRQPSYEQALTKCGIPFEYIERVPLESINITRGKQMQARLVPLDPNLINEYAEMLNDGYEPPPLLLWKHGKSLLTPLDGNQRLAANAQASSKHRLTHFSAYVVKNNDQMVVDRLCWSFNNLVNGRRLSYEECMEHAITFVRKYNQPIETTAKEWGVKAWELGAKVRELEIRDLAGKKGIETKNVPSQTIIKLHPLSKVGDDLMLRVLKTVAESGVGVDAVEELVSDVGKARTLLTKIKLMDDFVVSEKVIQSKASTKGGRILVRKGRNPREQLQKLLGGLETLLDEYGEPAFKPVGKADRERWSGSSLFISNKLISIYGLGSFLKGQGVA